MKKPINNFTLTLQSSRLTLRPVKFNDVADITNLLQDEDIATMTRVIPYPYTQQMAEEWAKTQHAECLQGNHVVLAITNRTKFSFMGITALTMTSTPGTMSLSYWLGKEFWGKGYTTEAVQLLVEYAFHHLNLEKVEAECLCSNDRSRRILEKLDMRIKADPVYESFRTNEPPVALAHYSLSAKERLLKRKKTPIRSNI